MKSYYYCITHTAEKLCQEVLRFFATSPDIPQTTYIEIQSSAFEFFIYTFFLLFGFVLLYIFLVI